MKTSPSPIEVQDFLFKQATFSQVFEDFESVPKANNLLSADSKRGLLYLGHKNKLVVLKPEAPNSPEWKLEFELPGTISHVTLNCDCSYLAVCLSKPSALIYNVDSLHKNNLDLVQEIRLSSSFGEVIVLDLKWNPAIPELLCSVTSDHSIGCFQVNKDRRQGVQIIGLEKIQNLEALCIAWSPKGKQLVVGCKNGSIIQLKPELKVARQILGPEPSEGEVISILWVSNFQFCACYFNRSTQVVNVVIVDAPKGESTASFTTYEDVTFGYGPPDDLRYCFEHISEWGVIIIASSHSGEVVVLGTGDNGASWMQWQLIEGGAQLPLIRKQKTETYPVGIAVDKTSTEKLPWGGENFLPNPVPILRILVTSGQLCSYHIINLKAGVPAICSTPTETVTAPPQQFTQPKPPQQQPPPQPQPQPLQPLQQQSIPQSEVSFNLPTGATSTPRPSKPAESSIDKLKSLQSLFPKSPISFLPPENKPQSNLGGGFQANTGFGGLQSEPKTGGMFGGQQENKLGTTFTVQSENPKINFPPNVDGRNLPPIHSNFGQKEMKTVINVPQYEIRKPDNNQREKIQENVQIPQTLQKDQGSKKEIYDDSICLRAYYEEQAQFEKELKMKLEAAVLNCISEEEKKILIEKSSAIEEFLLELKETTNSLSSDIAYLKALLLQSFAWLEETKSKNSANSNVSSRSRESNKLADLQRLFYYTQSQLTQATKVLDLQWAEHNSQELSKMKIPSVEKIYQTLIRYGQIIAQEKNNIDGLSKKWRSLGRASKISTNSALDRSLANLSINDGTNLNVTDNVIDLRCKAIANNTQSFSREKQARLREVLLVSKPRTIKPVRPDAVQDRLEATLSATLASAKTMNGTAKPKQSLQSRTPNVQKMGTPNPLANLNSFVSGIGSNSPANKMSSPSGPPVSAAKTMSFGQITPPSQPAATNISKSFAKVDSISFGSSSPKPPTATSNIKNFFGDSTNTFSLGGNKPTTTEASKSSGPTSVQRPAFSFTTPPVSGASFGSPKLDANPVFKFSTKPVSPASTQAPPAQGSLDFSLSFTGKTSGVTITPVQAKNTSASSPGQVSSTTFGATSPSQPFSFGPSNPPLMTTPVKSNSGGISGSDPARQSLQSMFKNTSTPTSSAPVEKTPPAAGNVSKALNLSPPKTATTTADKNPLAGFGASLSFGAPTSTLGSTAVTQATNSTSSSSTLFGSSTTTTMSSATTTTTPSFGGLLGATASLSFGSSAPTSDAQKMTKPAASPFSFSLSTTPAPTTTSAPATTTAKTDSTVTTTASSTTASTTTTSTSVFGGLSTTSIFGGQPATSNASNSGSIFDTKPATGSMFGGTTSTPTTTSGATSVFGSTSTTTSVPAFGASTTTTASSVFGGSTFGSSGNTNVFGSSTPSSTSIFGSTPASGASIFGGTASTTAPVFGTSTASTSAPAFGSTTTTTKASVFSTGSTPSTTSIFGGGATSTASATPVFGSSTATTSASVFGASTTSTSAPVFGSTTAPTNAFGTTPTNAPAFGSNSTSTQSSIFGGTPTTSTTSAFGGGGSVFGSAPVFGAAATPAATPAPAFGSPASTGATNSVFGGGLVFGSGTGTAGSMFGAAPAAAPAFGGTPAAASAFGGAPAFGPSSPSAMGTTSVFGQQSAFGAKPVFGSPGGEFGAAKPTFGSPGFGSPPAFGSVGGFGSPTMGSGSPLAGNNSMGKVFGESGGGPNAFEALGAQSGGLSFGSLAQKTPEPEKPPSFSGGSSFSSWR